MKEKKINIAIIGATGLVGQELIKLLEKDSFVKNLYLFASKQSQNKNIFIKFKKKKIKVYELNKKIFKSENFDLIFFCTSSNISKKYIPYVKNSIVIDSSSYFRYKKNVPLIIPQINGHLINDHLIKNKKIISSPNCTTTLMLTALHPLHREFKIKRIIASTYQAASGGGKALLEKLKEDTKKALKGFFKKNNDSNFYGFNLFLHESSLNKKKYSEEEIKLEKESQKILNEDIKISATCVRVPTVRAHALSLNVEFFKNPPLKKIYDIFKKDKNIKIFENFEKNRFATPLDATGKKEVFVSRIRKDFSKKNSIWLWVVADQLLKGAALNMYQIAKKI